jgi:hypothetical protein
MSRYLQTSTNNPYGHRPWATRIYTGFENYGFLKQPQNTILREDLNMRPEIYKPPEAKPRGMGGMIRRRTLGFIMSPPARYPGVRAVGPLPVNFLRMAPPQNGTPIPAPSVIYPPSIVPPVATIVSSSPDGVVYALPGSTVVPGSPYMPPAPGELTVPSPAPAAATSFSDWFNAQTYVSGLPNGYLAIGAVAIVFLFTQAGKKGRR